MVKRKLEYEKLKDVHGFINELSKESDRGAALLGAAFLELSLRDFLERHLIDDKKVMDEMFEGPISLLGTFYAKTRMAYCIGLIDKDIMKNLDIIRKIRREFAHQPHGLTFNDDQVICYCKNLKFKRIRSPNDTPRVVFIDAICYFAGYFAGIKHAEDNKKTNPSK